MQKDDHILDRYLKEKVEEAHFDFQEEYWLKVSALLDEEDKRKKRPFLWRWVTVLCVVLAVGAGTLIFTNQSKKANEKQPLADNRENAAPQPSGISIPAEVSYQADRPVAVDQTPKPTNAQNQATSGNSAPQQAAAGTKDPGGASSNANADMVPNAVTPSLSPEKRSAGDKVANNKSGLQNKRDAAQQMKVQAGAISPTPSGKAATQAYRAKMKKNKPAIQSQQSSSKDQAGTAPTNPVATQHGSDAGTVVLKGKAMQPVDTETYVRRVPRDETVYNPRYQAGLRDYVAEHIDSVTVYTYQPIAEAKPAASINANVQPAAPIVRDSVIKPSKALRFFVSGGAGFNKGFKGNMNTSVSWGIAPYLNLGTEKPVNEKIAIAAQIGFTYFNALNIQKKVTNYKYSFGFDSTQFKVDYQRMYQLLLPVSIAYQLNRYHTTFASLGGSYILNTLSKVNDQGNATAQNGYLGGFNPLDLFIQAGYQYTLDRRFALQALFQQGFLSATQKEYFNMNHNNTQTRFSLGLKYYFKRNGQ